MILDEIKDLIKELETILVKDKRFKECLDFKNQVKIIYNYENNLNKNFPIPGNIGLQLPSVDITPLVVSNLMVLSKPQELTKPSSDNLTAEDCKEALKEYKLSIERLLIEVDRAHKAGLNVTKDMISPEKISELLDLINTDPTEAAKIVNRII
jgi:hypothetical protein